VAALVWSLKGKKFVCRTKSFGVHSSCMPHLVIWCACSAPCCGASRRWCGSITSGLRSSRSTTYSVPAPRSLLPQAFSNQVVLKGLAADLQRLEPEFVEHYEAVRTGKPITGGFSKLFTSPSGHQSSLRVVGSVVTWILGEAAIVRHKIKGLAVDLQRLQPEFVEHYEAVQTGKPITGRFRKYAVRSQ
jgi:hypothetical protein